MNRRRLLPLLLWPAVASAADQDFTPKRGVPFVVRVQSKKPIAVTAVDEETQKAAKLILEEPAKNGWVESTNYLEMRPGASPRLQFRTRDGQKMFVLVDKSKRPPVVLLFATEQEMAASVKKEAAAAQGLKAEERAALERMAQQAQEKERMNLEAQEAMRREEMLRKQAALSRAEKEKRDRQALEVINEGNAKYAQGDYPGAVKAYARAAELDPSRNEIYYRYGVSLYKIDDYNKSMAMLSLAEGGPQNHAEHGYYVALNQLKMKEFDKARDGFVAVRDENDPDISGMAAFLAGTIDYRQRRFPEAKVNFEYVIDHSKDPKLDAEAERMLDEIDRQESFLAGTRDRLVYSLNAGFGYDGNVLNVASQNAPVDAAAYRGTYGGTLLYKFYQTPDSDFGGQLAYSDVYSVDKNFKPDATLQTSDPQLITASLPFHSRFELSRPFAWGMTPSITSLVMNAEGDGRKQIIQTTSLAGDLSFPWNAQWSSAFNIAFEHDASFLHPSSEDDDQTASRMIVGTTQSRLIDAKTFTTLAGDLNYTMNNATGRNSKFNKAAFGLTYSRPAFWQTQGSFRLDYTDLNYPDHASGRHDSAVTASLGAAKSLTKRLNLSAGLQYVVNGSTLEEDRYNKFVVTTSLVYTGSLLGSGSSKK